MLTLITQNQAGKVVIRLEDAEGVGITGVAAGSVTAQLSKNNAAAASFTLSGSNWVEIGSGFYSVSLAAVTDTGTQGPGLLIITHLGVVSGWPFLIRERDEGDVYDFVSAVDQSLAAVDTAVATIQATLNELDDNALTRMTVLTRDGSNRPLTARVYRWNTKANFDANGATGRVEYLVTCTYHASGRVDTFSKARV